MALKTVKNKGRRRPCSVYSNIPPVRLYVCVTYVHVCMYECYTGGHGCTYTHASIPTISAGMLKSKRDMRRFNSLRVHIFGERKLQVICS